MMNTLRHVGDGLSLGLVISTIAGWLPPIAALLSIVWLLIQLFEWFEKKYKHR